MLASLMKAVNDYLYAQLLSSPDPGQELGYRKAELMARNVLLAVHDRIMDETHGDFGPVDDGDLP